MSCIALSDIIIVPRPDRIRVINTYFPPAKCLPQILVKTLDAQLKRLPGKRRPPLTSPQRRDICNACRDGTLRRWCARTKRTDVAELVLAHLQERLPDGENEQPTLDFLRIACAHNREIAEVRFRISNFSIFRISGYPNFRFPTDFAQAVFDIRRSKSLDVLSNDAHLQNLTVAYLRGDLHADNEDSEKVALYLAGAKPVEGVFPSDADISARILRFNARYEASCLLVRVTTVACARVNSAAWLLRGSWGFPIRSTDAVEIRAAVCALRSEGGATHVVADARGDVLGVEIYADSGERADGARTNLHVLCATPWTSDHILAALMTHVLETIHTDWCCWHVYHPGSVGGASAWYAALARPSAPPPANADREELQGEMRALDSNVAFTNITESEMMELFATSDDGDATTDEHLIMEIAIPSVSQSRGRVFRPNTLSPSSKTATYRVGGWLARFDRGLMGRIREIVVRSENAGAHRSVRCWSVGKYGASVGVARVELDGGVVSVCPSARSAFVIIGYPATSCPRNWYIDRAKRNIVRAAT
ncbi:hypothetical protein CYMTET_7225 [Cymbomonas tetramitiformis]|nr:hypothetical protein CYMTET_7225 [Cymbomonas tetramitiformis]